MGRTPASEEVDTNPIPEHCTPRPFRSHLGRCLSASSLSRRKLDSTPDLRSRSKKRSATEVESPTSPKLVHEKKNKVSGLPVKNQS